MPRLSLKLLLENIRRFPIGFICGMLCLPLLVMIVVFRSQLQIADKKLDQINLKENETLDAVASIRLNRTQAAMTKSAVEQIEAGLIDEGNLAENLWYFYQIGQQTHTNISELHQQSSSMVKAEMFYRTVPFTLRVAGSYEQVANFLFRLETGPRMLRVGAFDIQRQNTGTDSIVMSLSLDVLTRP